MNNFFTTKITIILIMIYNLVAGQDFDILVQKKSFDCTFYAQAIANGNIFVATRHLNSYYSPGQRALIEFDYLADDIIDVNFQFNRLLMFNKNLEIEKAVEYKSSLDSITYVLNFQVDEPDKDIVVLVANLKPDTTKYYMYWYNLDLELEHSLEVPPAYMMTTNRIYGWHFIINDKNNVVCVGLRGFYELDKFGKKINTYPFEGTERYGTPSVFFNQNALGEYFSANPQNNYFDSFNNDLSLKEEVYYGNQHPKIRVSRDCNRLAISTNKKKAYATGFIKIDMLCDVVNERDFGYAEFIYEYDLIEPERPKIFHIDTPSTCTYRRYGEFAIDLFYDDHIYYSHSDADCGFIAPPGQEPTCFETYITLNCVDEEGNLRWQKYLGGDAAYLPQGVVATPDSGVVVFVLRHHPDENFRYEADIYVAKFDKSGNPVDLPTAGLVPVNEVLLNNTIKVYPNPVSSYLIVEGLQLAKQAAIKLYNSTGQLVFNEKISNNKINLHNLQNGYYTYAIFNKEGLLKADKVLKW